MRKQILIVDDDSHVLDLVSHFLEHSGYIVKHCRDGYSAVDEVAKGQYDLVLLDLQLPYIRGLKALKSIREGKQSNIPVIILTSSNNIEDVKRAKELGIDNYIVKPPMREDLVKRVELAIGSKPQFIELSLDKSDEYAVTHISFTPRLKSISQNGFVLITSFPLNKCESIEINKINILEKLNITQKKFPLVDSSPNNEGEFENIFLFSGLEKDDREKINAFIMEENFRRKSLNLKAS